MAFLTRGPARMARILRLDMLMLLAFIAGSCAFYTHYAHLPQYTGISRITQMLGEAFMKGQTHLLLAPNPKLATLADPYKVEYLEYRDIHDVSYYNGKYYLYFGPVPALLVWIPVKFITGYNLFDYNVALILACIGTGFLLLFTHAAARAIRPERDWLFFAGLFVAMLAVITCGWITFLLRRAFFYEVAIIGAYCFSSIGLWCIWKYLNRPGAYGWAALASLCFGLGVGCRISHIFSGMFLLVALAYVWRNREKRRHALAFLVATSIPMGFVLGGLGVYNYVRFGSFFETGWRYQLALYDQNDPDFRRYMPESVPLHAYKYLMHMPTWNDSGDFPYYATESDWGMYPSPETEPVYGILTNTPFMLFCLLILLPQIRRGWPEPLRQVNMGLLLYAESMLALLLVFFFSSERYVVDFAPWFLVLAACCFLQLLARYARRPAKYAILALGLLTLAYGIFNVSMLSYAGCVMRLS